MIMYSKNHKSDWMKNEIYKNIYIYIYKNIILAIYENYSFHEWIFQSNFFISYDKNLE